MLYKCSQSFTCHQTRAIPAFTPQLQRITALWLVLIAPTQGGMARLSWPGWLVRLRQISRRTPMQSPIPILTGPSVVHFCWCDICCYQLRQTSTPASPKNCRKNVILWRRKWDKTVFAFRSTGHLILFYDNNYNYVQISAEQNHCVNTTISADSTAQM